MALPVSNAVLLTVLALIAAAGASPPFRGGGADTDAWGNEEPLDEAQARSVTWPADTEPWGKTKPSGKPRLKEWLNSIAAGIGVAEETLVRGVSRAELRATKALGLQNKAKQDPDEAAGDASSEEAPEGETEAEREEREQEEREREAEERARLREQRKQAERRNDRAALRNADAEENRRESDRTDREMSTGKAEQDAAVAKAGTKGPGMPVNEKWFTFGYWRPLIFSVAWVALMIEVLAPVWDKFVPYTLVSESVLVSFTLFGFGFVVYGTALTESAGLTILLVNVACGFSFAIILLIGAISLTLKHMAPRDPVISLLTDISRLFRPILRLVVCAIGFNVVTSEAKVDWSQLAQLMALMLLGISLALTGVVSDIVAHIFIRLDDHFVEGDFITFEGDLVEVTRLEWRHTVGIKDSSSSCVYIPNSLLSSNALINQSKDNDHIVEVDIPVNMDTDNIEQAVKNCWGLFARTKEEGFSFVGPDGKEYGNQFHTDACSVWLKESCERIRITFVGKYFFSEPPPWDPEDGEEPSMAERQWDWERAWYFQVQWYNLECKGMNEKLGRWPYQDALKAALPKETLPHGGLW